MNLCDLFTAFGAMAKTVDFTWIQTQPDTISIQPPRLWTEAAKQTSKQRSESENERVPNKVEGCAAEKLL